MICSLFRLLDASARNQYTSALEVARERPLFLILEGCGAAVNDLLTKIEQLVTPILEKEDVELVDLTYQKSHGGWTLSFFLDKPNGITLDDCTDWSHRLGTILDASDVLDRAYVLEVSSPGLDRSLRKLKDFQKFAGQKVHVRLLNPLNGQKNFHGVLLGASENSIRLELDDKRKVDLPMDQLAKCRLQPVVSF